MWQNWLSGLLGLVLILIALTGLTGLSLQWTLLVLGVLITVIGFWGGLHTPGN